MMVTEAISILMRSSMTFWVSMRHGTFDWARPWEATVNRVTAADTHPSWWEGWELMNKDTHTGTVPELHGWLKGALGKGLEMPEGSRVPQTPLLVVIMCVYVGVRCVSIRIYVCAEVGSVCRSREFVCLGWGIWVCGEVGVWAYVCVSVQSWIFVYVCGWGVCVNVHARERKVLTWGECIPQDSTYLG